MRNQAEIAAIRFGEGLSPSVPAASGAADVLGQLDRLDLVASRFPIARYGDLANRMGEIATKRQTFRKAQRAGTVTEGVQKDYRSALRRFSTERGAERRAVLQRSLVTDAPFRERLTRFWADHFTVVGKNAITRNLLANYMEEAIRPHVSGHFADLLKAAVLHPMMLQYLDQASSIGPNARANKNGQRGLNENLAREVLELHTLGVDAEYSQSDVRQLAELFTGLSVERRGQFLFRPGFVEPGAEKVLGKIYNGDPQAAIHTLLDDLAAHKATAQHVARKLAVHFCSDQPDPGMVAAMTKAYLRSDGNLRAVYAAMLDHPAAWDSFGQKVKQPIDLIVSGLRALDVRPEMVGKLKPNKMRAYIGAPMAAMGQVWGRPNGPDGWPEDAESWITPHGLAARLQWSMRIGSDIYRALPDPREFAVRALGGLVDERLEFVAASAESRAEGIGLILASQTFQRR